MLVPAGPRPARQTATPLPFCVVTGPTLATPRPPASPMHATGSCCGACERARPPSARPVTTPQLYAFTTRDRDSSPSRRQLKRPRQQPQSASTEPGGLVRVAVNRTMCSMTVRGPPSGASCERTALRSGGAAGSPSIRRSNCLLGAADCKVTQSRAVVSRGSDSSKAWRAFGVTWTCRLVRAPHRR